MDGTGGPNTGRSVIPQSHAMHRDQPAAWNCYYHLYSREAISTSEKKEETFSPGLSKPMAYQDMDLRTETNILTHCFVPLAVLWPGHSMPLQDVHGYRCQPTQMVHTLFHKCFTQLQQLKKSFGPSIISMFGLGHPHTHTHCPHTTRGVYVCLCWTRSPLSPHLSGSKNKTTVKLVANSGPELSRY